MTKTEKLLQEDTHKREKVEQILKILDGEKVTDSVQILDAAKHFLNYTKFYSSATQDFLESL